MADKKTKVKSKESSYTDFEELKRKLWESANKLRMNMDAADYKHIVLGLIFLKYTSDLAIERENPQLKNILPKDFAKKQPNIRLGELEDLISTIGFNHSEMDSRDLLSQVYEYFLGAFASSEGKKGGQFYTPKSVVNLIVECLEPYKGKVYDPAMGSGGFFVSSEKFIEMHSDKKHINQAKRKISLYGQESDPTTWRLAAMNMAIRGMEFDFGKAPADTFSKNQHPDLKADFIMANPPFNISDWGASTLEGDRKNFRNLSSMEK